MVGVSELKTRPCSCLGFLPLYDDAGEVGPDPGHVDRSRGHDGRGESRSAAVPAPVRYPSAPRNAIESNAAFRLPDGPVVPNAADGRQFAETAVEIRRTVSFDRFRTRSRWRAFPPGHRLDPRGRRKPARGSAWTSSIRWTLSGPPGRHDERSPVPCWLDRSSNRSVRGRESYG